jgi:hypothetical protein
VPGPLAPATATPEQRQRGDRQGQGGQPGGPDDRERDLSGNLPEATAAPANGQGGRCPPIGGDCVRDGRDRCAPTSVLSYLTSGICPDGGRLVFTAPDGGADDSSQMQRDAQSDLGGDKRHYGTEGAVAGFIGDQL